MDEIIRSAGHARGRSKSVRCGDLIWSVATAQGEGDTVAAQTAATLAHLDANLEEAGSDKNHILEAVVYLTDMARKQEMDDVWCAWIPDGAWPNRACVGTDLAAGDLVEVKVTARRRARGATAPGLS